MNRHPLLAENENKQINVGLSLLLCLSMFATWQMGIMLFSGKTLSIGAKTPIPFALDSNVITALVAAGFIADILFLIFLQRHSVMAARLSVSIALLSALMFYLPLPPHMAAMLFYIQAFSCVFLMGSLIAVIINLLTEKAAIKEVIISLISSGCLIAILQNDVMPIPFGVFRGFTIVALAMLLLFFCKMPKSTWPEYAKKSDDLVKPKAFMVQLFALIGFSSVITLFGGAVAYSVEHGISVYYLSSAVCGIILAVLWKRFHIMPLKSASVMIAVGALGFLLAIASLYVPELSLPACALLGAGGISGMSSYLGVVMAKQYPSRFITPGIIGLGFAASLVQTVLLYALRDNLTLLYVVYLVIAVALVILYLLLEPYLGYSFRCRTLEDLIGVVAEETDVAAVLEPVTVLATVSGTDNISKIEAEPKAEQTEGVDSPQALRMRTLLQHTLSPLTRREYQLADCIMRGQRRSEIAEEMGVKPETVTKYTNQLYNKFGIHRRQDLFRLAEQLDRGWLEIDE
ncbi:MAG: LuxR C-terminal-related transcriptional regulator [Acetivibrionales bacterium]|jgi:DNA-binding CsgD family transcriptional regulator